MNRNRPLVALLLVNGVACIGTRISAIAIPWFVLVSTGSALQTGLVAAFELGPYVLAKALAGPVTDRLGQRRVSVATDLASMLVIGGIPIAHLFGLLTLPLLLALVAVGGALRGPGDSAKHTAIPMVAEAAGTPLERVTGLYGAIERSSGLIAPALAAGMIHAVSAVGAIALTAACFGLSALIAGLGIPHHGGPSEPVVAGDGYLTRLRSGWTFLRSDRLLMLLVAMIAITNLWDVAKQTVLLPVWAQRSGHGVAGIGVLLTAMALCSVASSLVASAYGSRLPRRLTYFTAFAVAGPPPFLALALDLPLWALAVVYAVAGLASGFLNPMIGAMLFERIPRPLVGRVGSLVDAATWAAMPFGGVLAAGLISGVGFTPALVVGGLAYGLVVLIPAAAGSTSFDRPADPIGSDEPPDRPAVVRLPNGSPVSGAERQAI